jgi:hypothetical protein
MTHRPSLARDAIDAECALIRSMLIVQLLFGSRLQEIGHLMVAILVRPIERGTIQDIHDTRVSAVFQKKFDHIRVIHLSGFRERRLQGDIRAVIQMRSSVDQHSCHFQLPGGGSSP